MLGVDWASRGQRMDESVAILRGLAAGGYFEYHGKVFDLPSIKIAGKQLVGMKAGFVRKTDGSYELLAGGNGPGITAQMTLRVNPNDDNVGGGATVAFQAPAGAGLPLLSP